jgi:hypothetical protein
MKPDRSEEGRLSNRGEGLGTATEDMVQRRAREIAVINGREENNVLDGDVEQARRELQGRERLHSDANAAESVPESQRWAPVPESVGRKAPTVPAPDEQTVAEKLVEEGVADAEHDQMIKATRDSLRRDQT